MAEAYLNYIGGQWLPSRSGNTFESRNPAHPAEVIGVFPRSGRADVEAADVRRAEVGVEHMSGVVERGLAVADAKTRRYVAQ